MTETPNRTEVEQIARAKAGNGGGVALDPTANVSNLLEAAVKRIDDLREAETRRLNDLRVAETRRIDDLREAESRRVDEQSAIRAEYTQQLGEAESKRIDAIRAVDVAAVGVASERATQQASVLANQVNASAETLRTLVASTETARTQAMAQLSNQLNERIASLEKSQYASQGSGSGMQSMWGWIMAALMALIGIGGIVAMVMKTQ